MKVKIYLLYILAILMAGATFYLLAHQTVELKQAVDKLKADNSQQTIILCTLILSQNSNLTGDDVAKVEAICREKIRQTSADITPSSPVSAPANQAPVVENQSNQLPASSNVTPLSPQAQPDNPQPSPTPQSIIPFVKDPLLLCVTNKVCI